MGIREDRAADAAAFVSIRNLVEGLSSIEDLPVSEIAGFLLGALRGEKLPQFVRLDQQALRMYQASSDTMQKLLRHVATGNDYDDDEWNEIDSRDFDRYGWVRVGMEDFLQRMEIDVPPCCLEGWKPEHKKPDWYPAYANRFRLTIDEAVFLILGADPEDSTLISDDSFRLDYWRWRKALVDAIGSFNFNESSWGADQGEQSLLHEGIKVWANYTGAPWPFLDESISNKSLGHKAIDISSSNSSSTNPEIVQRLAAAEVKAEQLAFALANVTSERNQARNEIERLTTCLVETTKAANIAQADVTALKTQLTDQPNLLSTQGRNSALLIMAALAKEAKLDVNQPSRTGEILSSSVSELGCSLTGRAISAWLSDIPRALETRAK